MEAGNTAAIQIKGQAGVKICCKSPRHAMGKQTSGRRIAVQSGRFLMEKVENLMKGGAISKPVWYDAAKQVPPPSVPTWAPRPKDIVFPEDKLMKLYKRMNPDWSNEVLKMHPEAQRKGEKTRAHMFVSQWQKHIDKGMTQDDAYQKVEAEFYEVEGKIAAERDAEIVKQLRAGSVPELEEVWAEESKYADQAVAYHKAMWSARKNKTAEAAILAAKPPEPPAEEDDADSKPEPASKGKRRGSKADAKK